MDRSDRWKIAKSFYCDGEEMVDRLSSGLFYQETYFSSEVNEESLDTVKVDAPIKRWDNQDQCQLFCKAMQ